MREIKLNNNKALHIQVLSKGRLVTYCRLNDRITPSNGVAVLCTQLTWQMQTVLSTNFLRNGQSRVTLWNDGSKHSASIKITRHQQ